MTNSLEKSAIITGASGGIGGEVARRLVRDGFGVVIHYAGKPAPAQARGVEVRGNSKGWWSSNCAHLCEDDSIAEVSRGEDRKKISGGNRWQGRAH